MSGTVLGVQVPYGRTIDMAVHVSPDHAQKVINKWSKWMLTNPYEKCKGKWRLGKAISAHKINVLCTPIEIPGKDKVPLPTLRRLSQPKTPAKKRKAGKKVDSGSSGSNLDYT